MVENEVGKEAGSVGSKTFQGSGRSLRSQTTHSTKVEMVTDSGKDVIGLYLLFIYWCFEIQVYFVVQLA